VDYQALCEAVVQDAALRRRQRLQPAGGKGDKIFPPTYPEERGGGGPRHVYERRRVDGTEVWCVLLDSVQSQANRLEEVLLAALRDGSITLPYVTVDFTGKELAGVGEITSLDAPHRVYDAILRDSLLDGRAFMKSQLGVRLAEAKPSDATALLEASPTALLFGAWHSTGEGGGLGAKFPRCLVSEIVAVNTPVDEIVDQRSGEIEVRTSGRRTGSRIDPLGILAKVPIYQARDNPADWTAYEAHAAMKPGGKVEPVLFSRKKGDKAGRPSVINHGNVAPLVQPLGITCDYAEHTAVISLAGLRRLGFGGNERNNSGRALLAALGLAALTEQDARPWNSCIPMAAPSRSTWTGRARNGFTPRHTRPLAMPVSTSRVSRFGSCRRINWSRSFAGASVWRSKAKAGKPPESHDPRPRNRTSPRRFVRCANPYRSFSRVAAGGRSDLFGAGRRLGNSRRTG